MIEFVEHVVKLNGVQVGVLRPGGYGWHFLPNPRTWIYRRGPELDTINEKLRVLNAIERLLK